MITHNQHDPKWRNVRLGRTWFKLNRWGCATFSLSTLSDRFGCYRSPEDLAAGSKHYNARGQLIWENVAFDKMKFEKRVRGRVSRAIDASLQPGKGVLLELNFGAHWVLATGKAERPGEYLIIDPLIEGETTTGRAGYRVTGSCHYIAK